MAPVTHMMRPAGVAALEHEAEARLKGHEKPQGQAPFVPQATAAERLEWVAEKATSPFSWQWKAMLLMPLGWVAGKIGGAKARAWVRAPLTAFEALNTPIGELHQMPANVVRAYANDATSYAAGLTQAAKEAGKAVPKAAADAEAIAKGVEGLAERLSKGGHDLNARYVSPITAPLSRAMNGVADGVAAKPISALNRMVERFADRRIASIERKSAGLAAKLAEAHQTQAVGFVTRVRQAVGMAQPVQVAGLSDTHAVYQAAQAVRGGASVSQHHSVFTGFLNPSNIPDLSGEQAMRYARVNRLADKISKTASRIPFWEGVRTEGVRMLPKMVGRVPLLSALIGVGIVAGGAAAVLRTREANDATSMLFKEFAADVYGTTPDKVTKPMLEAANVPPIIGQARVRLGKEQRSNWIGTGLDQVGQVAWMVPGATMGMQGMMAMAPLAMMGQGIGLVKDLLTVENPMLQAYGVLKAVEQQKLQLPPDKILEFKAALIAGAPVFQANGGEHNKARGPLAQAMDREGLTVAQMVKEMATPGALEARAAKLKQAQQAEAAAKAAPVAAGQAAPMEEKAPTPTAQPLAAAPQIAAAGAQAFKVNAAAHEGRVAEMHRARA